VESEERKSFSSSSEINSNHSYCIFSALRGSCFSFLFSDLLSVLSLERTAREDGFFVWMQCDVMRFPYYFFTGR